MQNPASPPKSERTCPTCSMPVEHGNKFCATCGTRIPELLTCSKCGTEFTAPIKYCDLCGAPVILGEVPEPDDSSEHSEEEKTPGWLKIRHRNEMRRKFRNQTRMNYRKTMMKKTSYRMRMRLRTIIKRKFRNRIRMNYWNNLGRDMGRMRLWNPTIRQNPRLQ